MRHWGSRRTLSIPGSRATFYFWFLNWKNWKDSSCPVIKTLWIVSGWLQQNHQCTDLCMNQLQAIYICMGDCYNGPMNVSMIVVILFFCCHPFRCFVVSTCCFANVRLLRKFCCSVCGYFGSVQCPSLVNFGVCGIFAKVLFLCLSSGCFASVQCPSLINFNVCEIFEKVLFSCLLIFCICAVPESDKFSCLWNSTSSRPS